MVGGTEELGTALGIGMLYHTHFYPMVGCTRYMPASMGHLSTEDYELNVFMHARRGSADCRGSTILA